jgi:hypothetical protein
MGTDGDQRAFDRGGQVYRDGNREGGEQKYRHHRPAKHLQPHHAWLPIVRQHAHDPVLLFDLILHLLVL